MADYVLDTHACVFALAAPKKLGRAARRAFERIEAGHAVAWIPAAVVAEVILLHELRRIDLGLAELKDAMEQAQSLRFLPLDLQQLEDFAVLSVVREPFDRLIIGAARAKGAKLITRDQRIVESKLVQTVWD